MSNRIWILGADDPEMAAIERLLTDAGEQVAYAVTCPADRHVRVHPGNAYAATGYFLSRDPLGFHHGPAWADVTHIVECGCKEMHLDGDGPVVWRPVVIDHHRTGDPGYGRPPEEFLAASSIGQVIAELERLMVLRHYETSDYDAATSRIIDYKGWVDADYEMVITQREAHFVAAADHCLEPAYRGRCPGVDPDALMRWRVESRAAFQGRTVEAVMADVEVARARLREAVEVVHTSEHDWSRSVCDGCRDALDDGAGLRLEYADLRGQHIPELPEASAREGIPFVSDGLPGPDGRVKFVCQSAPPELIERFMRGEIVVGLTEYYGDPARGFAGGYVSAVPAGNNRT